MERVRKEGRKGGWKGEKIVLLEGVRGFDADYFLENQFTVDIDTKRCDYHLFRTRGLDRISIFKSISDIFSQVAD